jgi:hypothetical protein
MMMMKRMKKKYKGRKVIKYWLFVEEEFKKRRAQHYKLAKSEDN